MIPWRWSKGVHGCHKSEVVYHNWHLFKVSFITEGTVKAIYNIMQEQKRLRITKIFALLRIFFLVNGVWQMAN